MDKYIKKKGAYDVACNECEAGTFNDIPSKIMGIPSADVVERKVLDQVYWERDTALHQLDEIGKGLGEKMDDVICLDLSPVCVGCDGKTADGKTTDLCDYKTTYKRCFEQGKKLVDIAKAYFNGELVKRKHGKWYGEADGYADGELVYDMWSCPFCGKRFEEWDDEPTWNFCPNCGADMRGKNDESED